MQKVRHACFWCLRKVWQVFAVSLVLMAVVVSLLKYSLPYANDYKSEIETLLSEQLNTQISIGSISAGWEHTGPALVLNQVSFKSDKLGAFGLSVEQTRFHANIWQSLLQQRLVSNYFVLAGLNANIDLNHTFQSTEGQPSATNLIELLETLFLASSGHFALENSQLSIVTKHNETRLIALERITWQNRKSQHQGVGYVTLPGISDNRLEVILDLYGDNFATAFGNVFIESKQLDASSWLQDAISTDVTQIKSNINFQAWARFKELNFENIQLTWLPSKIEWQEAGNQQEFHINSGSIRLKPATDGWLLETSKLQIGTIDSQWTSFGGRLKFSEDKVITQWQNLPLELISEFSPLMPNEQLKLVEQIKLSGIVSSVFFEFDDIENYFLEATVDDLSWQQYNGLPGAQKLSLMVTADHNAGRIRVHGEDDYLLTGNLFTRPLPYEQIDVTLDLIKSAQGWMIQSDNIWLHNDELTLAAELSLDLYAQSELNLYAEVRGPDALLAKHYFPRGYMPQDTIDYLTRALRGGRIEFAQLLWQGKLAEFPYLEQNGRFLVDANVVDATFNFNPAWPDITDLQASLVFSNERMDIYSQQGEMAGLSLGNGVQVSIDNLMDTNWLNVDVRTQQDAEALKPFFNVTPLDTSIGSVLEVVQGRGLVNGQTRIQVPLGESQQKTVQVSGKVQLNENRIFIARPGIPFENVTGELVFNNSDISLQNASATWLNMPFNFNLTGKPEKLNYELSVTGDAVWQVSDIVGHTQGVMDGFIAGVVPFEMAFDMTLKPQGFNYLASARSDLKGFSSNLPQPYRKQSDVNWPLEIKVRGDDISNLVTAQINQQLYFNSIVDNRQGKVTNAHLIVGEQDLGINASGFDVSVRLGEADLVDWIPFIDHLVTTPSSSAESNAVFPALKQVDAVIEYAELSDIEFNDLEINLLALAQSTQLKVNGKEVRAEVSIPRVLAQRPVFIEADYLKLNFKKAQSETSLGPVSDQGSPRDNEWLTHLPAIRFNCADCKIDRYHLDKITLNLDPAENGVLISQFDIDKGKHQFSGRGSWQKQQTNLKGQFVSKDIGELTDEFDLTSSIKESSANIDVDLSWYGTPYQFNTESLSGDLKWELGDGYITDISDGGARVFSLLSLDSLVRKLKLDFRDVFAKGFFYNSMRGSMQIDNGIAHTDDAELNGVPADMTIKGQTNLTTRQIDYTMWVAPEVTSSIPVIVAWMVNPVTGLAALAIDKVLHSARVISEIEYAITGSLDKPVVTEKGKKSREIDLPQSESSSHSEQRTQQDDLSEERKIVPAQMNVTDSKDLSIESSI